MASPLQPEKWVSAIGLSDRPPIRRKSGCLRLASRKSGCLRLASRKSGCLRLASNVYLKFPWPLFNSKSVCLQLAFSSTRKVCVCNWPSKSGCLGFPFEKWMSWIPSLDSPFEKWMSWIPLLQLALLPAKLACESGCLQLAHNWPAKSGCLQLALAVGLLLSRPSRDQSRRLPESPRVPSFGTWPNGPPSNSPPQFPSLLASPSMTARLLRATAPGDPPPFDQRPLGPPEESNIESKCLSIAALSGSSFSMCPTNNWKKISAWRRSTSKERRSSGINASSQSSGPTTNGAERPVLP